jgi:hypothetical protein
MSSVRVRVRAADADPADPGVEVELPVTPGGWGSEHTERVANAVGVDTHSALVSLHFADGESEGLPAGRGGWRLVAGMEPGDVLVVDSGAGGGAPPAVPVLTTVPSPGAPTSRTRGGGVNPCGPVEGEPLPEEEQNSKRLNMLFLSGPAEVRKALQQVCLHATLSPSSCPRPCRTV